RKLNGNNIILNWDNDLSNSAEDFLKKKNGNFNEIFDLNSFSKEIRTILNQSYYNEENYLNKIITIPYINEDADIENIIHILKNSYKFIFSNDYNIIGPPRRPRPLRPRPRRNRRPVRSRRRRRSPRPPRNPPPHPRPPRSTAVPAASAATRAPA
ncbi:MAG: hypothetical protein IKM84_03010, partial [Oscillospiraceae bacterium]|nr:hypothetical protein [Oscillospiraceae bacterium]